MKRVLLPAFVFLGCSLAAEAVLPVGKPAPAVSLSGSAGGRLDGTPWSSSESKGKVTVLFYVDPDEKDLNEHVAVALRKEAFPSEKFASVAVINLAATWKPNWLIEKILAGKQKQYPRTLYIRDKVKALVEHWGLTDNSYDIVVFDRQGTVIFSKDGQLTETETLGLVQLIKENL